MNGYDRLKSLYKNRENKQRDNTLVQVIKYLLKQPSMNEQYLVEDKNLNQMMEFITNKAREQSVNNTAVVEDIIVYQWAMEYFSKSNKELELVISSTKEDNKKEVNNNQLNLELG